MRRILTILSIVALMARSMVPSGFMLAPVPSGDGAMTFVLCTGHGPQIVKLGADGKPIPTKPGTAPKELCAFAGFVLLGAPDLVAGAVSAEAFNEIAFVEPRVATLPPARAGPSIGPRAPPYLS